MVGSGVVVGGGVVVGSEVVVGGRVVVAFDVVVGGGVVVGSEVVVGADVVTGSDVVVGERVVDSSVVLGGLVVSEGVLGAGLVVEEPEKKKHNVVLSQPLTVSKTREAFMSNASQTGGNHFALMSSGFAQKFRAKLFFKRRDTCQHKLGSVNEYSKTEGLTFG